MKRLPLQAPCKKVTWSQKREKLLSPGNENPRKTKEKVCFWLVLGTLLGIFGNRRQGKPQENTEKHKKTNKKTKKNVDKQQKNTEKHKKTSKQTKKHV